MRDRCETEERHRQPSHRPRRRPALNSRTRPDLTCSPGAGRPAPCRHAAATCMYSAAGSVFADAGPGHGGPVEPGGGPAAACNGLAVRRAARPRRGAGVAAPRCDGRAQRRRARRADGGAGVVVDTLQEAPPPRPNLHACTRPVPGGGGGDGDAVVDIVGEEGAAGRGGGGAPGALRGSRRARRSTPALACGAARVGDPRRGLDVAGGVAGARSGPGATAGHGPGSRGEGRMHARAPLPRRLRRRDAW
jgi:hypothetical protein